MPEEMWDIWESGLFVGDTRPVTRATVQKAVVKKSGNARTLAFSQTEPQYEIPGLKSVTIDRRLGADAATMTLTLANNTPLDPLTNLDTTYSGGQGPTRRQLGDLGAPGQFSFRRGITPSSAERWGHDMSEIWVDMLIPNRVIRTFQGYGSDGAAQPWNDTKLVLTGVWIIDRVEYTSSGTITVTCRDQAKLLIEQRLYPPIIPAEEYPLEFCADHFETTLEEFLYDPLTGDTEVIGDNVASHIPNSPDSSAAFYYGYDGSVWGHKASHMFDGDWTSYWLSPGHSSPAGFEWMGGFCGGEAVNRIQVRPKFGGYTCYVSIKQDGVWLGTGQIPANIPGFAYNETNIPYVQVVTIPAEEKWFQIQLITTWQVEEYRLTFTNLKLSPETGDYRAAIYDTNAFNQYYPVTQEVGYEEVETFVPGNITDYTEIVKLFCAWAGFHWPDGAPYDNLLNQWGTAVGRVWGDFFYSGAYPVEPPCIPASYWDNKSLMDGVNQIKEILGFIFYVDSYGGAVWRPPNIWRTGNYITGQGFVGYDSVRTIDEEKVLLDYGVTIDDKNLRSEIVIVSSEDPTLYAAIQPGFAVGEVVPSAVGNTGDLALLGGQDRIMLVPNYPFLSQEEVDKFAYLVSLWIHWSYRLGKFRIPGNPAFEPDDQVRIFERVTSEAYVHYLRGIRSSMDMDRGTWHLDVETHWLGDGPDREWVVNSYQDMPPSLFAYLLAIGAIADDVDPALVPIDLSPYEPPPEIPLDTRPEEDLDVLFPDPPAISYPYDDSWSDEEIAIDSGSDYNGSGGVNSRSEKWRFEYWGQPGSNLVTIEFMRVWLTQYGSFPPEDIPKNTHSGQLQTVRTTVPAQAANAYRLMAQVFADEGYYVYSCAAYAGSGRLIAGTSVLSAHAWGLAIDINPDVNECCSTAYSTWIARPTSSKLYAAAQRIKQITTGNGQRVFGWGGDWTSKKDWMHFEVICTADALRTGVSL